MSDRVNIAFSANGRYACSLAVRGHGPVLERWLLDGADPRHGEVRGVVVDDRAYGLPLDDGSVLLLRSAGDGGADSGGYEIVHLRFDPTSVSDAAVTACPLGEVPGLACGYLLPSRRPDRLGVAVVLEATGQTSLWACTGSPPRLARLARVPGCLSGGVWLGADLLACTQRCEGAGTSGVAVDLASGDWRCILSVAPASTDRIVGYGAPSRRLFVASNADGGQRLGWGVAGQGRVEFPTALDRSEIEALCTDGTGQRLLVGEADGAVTRLGIYDPAADRLTPLPCPPGVVRPPGCWTDGRILAAFSAPGQPTAPATLYPAAAGARPSAGLDGDGQHARTAANRCARHAELVTVDGAAAAMEAIAYGGRDWRRSARLVLAVHGGPASAWRFTFNPLLEALAAAGIGVLAPNQRGSTGYGRAYLQAMVGDWGGADLDDICHLGRRLAEHRQRHGLAPPILLGASYGAFLALLAAGRAPRSFSGVVALAPLLSGPALHADGSPAVRRRVAELGGLAPAADPEWPRDGRGHSPQAPRDVRATGTRITAPVLIAHGTGDQTIPVEHSRTLAALLSALGRTEGVDFDYVEVDGDHPEVASAEMEPLRSQVLRFCLARPATAGVRSPAPSAAGEGQPAGME